jgi:two-component system chemotaxis response regulator CheY
MKENKILQTGEPAGAPLQRPTEPPCRILVVDDYREIRQLSAEVLIHSGYAVDAVADGAVAWEALQVKAFNLLITDNDMPRLTGVELVRKLRSAHMALPVILATGRLPTEELAQNPSLQLAAMLPKPFSPEELLGTVTNVLSATVSAPGQIEPLPDWRSQPNEEHDLEMTRFITRANGKESML